MNLYVDSKLLFNGVNLLHLYDTNGDKEKY